MADFNFPPSPLPNQEHVENGNTYIWNGFGWAIKTVPAEGGGSIPPESAAALAYSGLQVNGSLDIDLANQGALIPLGAGGLGAHASEGWRVDKDGTCELTVQRVASVFPGYANEMKVAVTVAQPVMTTETIDISHMIEANRIVGLGWGTAAAKPLTVGFWVKSPVAGTFPIYAVGTVEGSGQGATITIAAPDVAQWEFKVVTVSGDTAGTWLKGSGLGLDVSFALMAGSGVTAVPGGWGAGSFVAAPGQVNNIADVTDTFFFTGLLVLPGILAPTAAQAPLVMRTADKELEACKRLWRKLAYINIAGYGNVGSGEVAYVTLSPSMRITPIITFNQVGATNTSIMGADSIFPDSVVFQTVPTVVGGFFCIADAFLDARLQ